jgi:hypothetical protein
MSVIYFSITSKHLPFTTEWKLNMLILRIYLGAALDTGLVQTTVMAVGACDRT